MLVVDRMTQQAVGLMILIEIQAERGTDETEVRLGYLLAGDSWGKGIASELVEGFVSWCRKQTSISSIAGGVALNNQASKRVLQKNGFSLSSGSDEIDQGEQTYRLSLR